jgi:hypothetical protein
MLTIEKILILSGMGIGSVENYANRLIDEMDTRVPKWYVVSPFYTELEFGIFSADVTFMCSKYQDQITEKQAYLEQDFSDEIKALEKTLNKVFSVAKLKLYEIVPNFSKLGKAERVIRENFGNVQITSMFAKYTLKISVGQMKCFENSQS